MTLFEPFPSEKLLAFMREFAAGGGRLIWSGPPPLVTFEGQAALEAWQNLLAWTTSRARRAESHCPAGW